MYVCICIDILLAAFLDMSVSFLICLFYWSQKLSAEYVYICFYDMTSFIKSCCVPDHQCLYNSIKQCLEHFAGRRNNILATADLLSSSAIPALQKMYSISIIQLEQFTVNLEQALFLGQLRLTAWLIDWLIDWLTQKWQENNRLTYWRTDNKVRSRAAGGVIWKQKKRQNSAAGALIIPDQTGVTYRTPQVPRLVGVVGRGSLPFPKTSPLLSALGALSFCILGVATEGPWLTYSTGQFRQMYLTLSLYILIICL